MPTWRLELWGVPRLAAQPQGEPDVALPLSRKDAAWLALVALVAPRGGIGKRQLAARVWPNRSEASSLNNLHQRLHRLRARCGGAETCLVRLGAAPALADDLVAVLPDNASLRRDPTAWDDDLLQPFEYPDEPDFAEWLNAERASWALRKREAMIRLADEAENAGLLTEALAHAKRLQSAEPYSEASAQRLMRLHYRRGDVGSAIIAFEQCERVLKDELGMRPSPQTLALLSTVEQRQRGADLYRPSLPGTPMPVELLHPPLTVGREAEQARLRQAHGDGLVAVVIGEAGSGKTRLLQDFVAAHPSAIHIQARRHDSGVPYGLVARIVRGLAKAVPQAVDAALRATLGAIVVEWTKAPATEPTATGRDANAVVLTDAVRELLQSAAVRHLDTLALDDLQFADSASLEALQEWLEDPALASRHWVFAHRPLAAAEPDAAFLQSLTCSSRAARIELAALDIASTRRLLQSLRLGADDGSALAQTLLQRIGGNPQHLLFALQAWRHHDLNDASVLRDLSPPKQVADLLARRLTTLSADAAAVARVAAVAAPDFSLELAADVLERNPLTLVDAWCELEAAAVFRSNGFSHDLVHEAMVLATPQPFSQHIHRKTARFLVSRGQAEPAAVARHWLAAAAHAEAAAALVEAAERAMQAGRARERAGFLQQAAASFEAAGDTNMAMRIGAEAARALVLSDSAAAGLALTDGLLAKAVGPRHRGLVEAARSYGLGLLGRGAEAAAAARTALEFLSPEDDDFRLVATQALATHTAESGDTAAALALLAPWHDRMHCAPDLTQMVYWGIYATAAYQDSRIHDAIDAARRQLACAERAQAVDQQIVARMNLCAYSLRLADVTTVLAEAMHVERLTRDRSEHAPLARWNDLHFVLALVPMGRLGEALQRLEDVCAGYGGDSSNRALQCLAENCLAQVFLYLGQPDKAQHRLVDDYADLPSHRHATRLTVRAAAERFGQTGRAPTLLRAAVDACTGTVGAFVRLYAQLELLRDLDNPAAAARDAMACKGEAGKLEFRALSLIAAWRRLNALVAMGDLQAVSELAACVRQQSGERLSQTIWQPEVLLDCANAFDKAGRPTDADGCLQEAQRWVVDVALPNVPHAFRDSFLHRNPVHVALRERLRVRGWAPRW